MLIWSSCLAGNRIESVCKKYSYTGHWTNQCVPKFNFACGSSWPCFQGREHQLPNHHHEERLKHGGGAGLGALQYQMGDGKLYFLMEEEESENCSSEPLNWIFITNNHIASCSVHRYGTVAFTTWTRTTLIKRARLLKRWFEKIDSFEIWLRVCVDCWQLILGLTGLQRPSNYANIPPLAQFSCHQSCGLITLQCTQMRRRGLGDFKNHFLVLAWEKTHALISWTSLYLVHQKYLSLCL